MSDLLSKQALKKILGDIPFTAELYYFLHNPGKPLTQKYSLAHLKRALPEWRTQVEASPTWKQDGKNSEAKKIFLFGTQRYWIEHTALLGMALAGMGHQPTLAYLPYASWQTPSPRFDLRRLDVYTRRILSKAEPVMKVVSFFERKPARQSLPVELEQAVRHVALRDTQYTLQVERVELESNLHHLRLARNLEAASIALEWMRTNPPEIVIVPNGTILEFGVIYQVARYLGIPVMTYEFGEQRQRIWLAQNSEVMSQETDDLWRTLGYQSLEEEQLAQVRQLFASRQRASLFENFARRWQGVPGEGGEKVRAALHLDGRPVVLLATNVIGDSLTLDRQVFSASMTEWIERTVEYFFGNPRAQLVIRIHPGELVTKGPSVADVVIKKVAALSGAQAGQFPEHMHLIAADAKVNTYDLVEIADIGLVYTTTVGMEMAMSGLPVIPSGKTHYRGKGFTLDAHSWEEYFELLVKMIEDPAGYRLKQEQVNLAWNYAYRFFYNYPLPFPWHLAHQWKDIEEWPLSRVFSQEGQEKFGRTFQYLIGKPIQW